MTTDSCIAGYNKLRNIPNIGLITDMKGIWRMIHILEKSLNCNTNYMDLGFLNGAVSVTYTGMQVAWKCELSLKLCMTGALHEP